MHLTQITSGYAGRQMGNREFVFKCGSHPQDLKKSQIWAQRVQVRDTPSVYECYLKLFLDMHVSCFTRALPNLSCVVAKETEWYVGPTLSFTEFQF